ncbi:hypothetical protein GCM10027047_10090 [Rhodococcus aerolatus]
MAQTSRATGPSGSPLVGRGDADRTAAITRSLLGYGVLVGPFYVVAGLVQALLRPGFELTRHDLSLLARGDWGWVQVVVLVASGLMVVAAGLGMGRSLRALGRGSRWGSWLVVGYGVGLVGAGLFRADPMNGFPPGTPDGPAVTTTAGGVGHLVLGGLGFVSLVAACVVHARRLRAEQRTGLATLSVVTAVVFTVAFAAIATGSSAPAVVLGFWAAVVLAWVWLAAVSVDLYRRTPLLTPAR